MMMKPENSRLLKLAVETKSFGNGVTSEQR